MTRQLPWAALFAFATYSAFGQTAAAPPAFEVASVKPAPPPTGPGLRVGMNQDAGRITMSNVTLKNVIARAYSVKEHQIMGPDWLGSARYDIVAKLPPDTPKDQVPLMLQTLLAERFKFAIHKESKVMPVYALVVAKNGPKLHEADAEGGLRMMMSPKGMQMMGKTQLSRLADALSNQMDRPVIDMTEIKGVFDIDLSWTPDDSSRMGAKVAMMGGGPGPGPGPGPGAGPGPGPGAGPSQGPRPEGGAEAKMNDGPDGASIFTALQEKLGLKLEARKSAVEIIVIDHVEKVPTEN